MSILIDRRLNDRRKSAVNRQRWQRWERGVERRQREQGQAVYERIRRGDPDWLSEFI